MSRAFPVLILSILLLACATDQEIEQQIADSPVVLEVTATQLQADYETNDVAADLKYKDKVIAVSGIVAGIVSKDSGGASVELETFDSIEGVRCHFTEQHVNDVAGLREGDWVKLRGQGEGKGLTDIFDVSVRACSLLEHQPGGATAAQPTPSAPVAPTATIVVPSATQILMPTTIPASTTLPTAAPTHVPTSTPRPTLTFEVQKVFAKQIPYDDLFRNNEEHIGKFVSYIGEVVQVVEGEDGSYNLRANVSRGEYSWDDTVFLYYSGPRVLEGDIIEFLGVVHELITYESVWQQEITIPAVEVTASRVVGKAGSPIPTPNPTATPQIPPTPMTPGLALNDPLPAGSTLRGTDGSEIVVTGIVEDAWPLIKAARDWATPPEPGNHFYMVTVAVSYVSGTDSLDVAEADYNLIGDNRVVYKPWEDSCGVIPDELGAELFPGGQTEGNVCFQIEGDDDNFVLIHKPLYDFDGERRFLKLE